MPASSVSKEIREKKRVPKISGRVIREALTLDSPKDQDDFRELARALGEKLGFTAAPGVTEAESEANGIAVLDAHRYLCAKLHQAYQKARNPKHAKLAAVTAEDIATYLGGENPGSIDAADTKLIEDCLAVARES